MGIRLPQCELEGDPPNHSAMMSTSNCLSTAREGERRDREGNTNTRAYSVQHRKHTKQAQRQLSTLNTLTAYIIAT